MFSTSTTLIATIVLAVSGRLVTSQATSTSLLGDEEIGASITAPAIYHPRDALATVATALNCSSYDYNMDPDFWRVECESQWEVVGTPSTIVNSCGLGYCENADATVATVTAPTHVTSKKSDAAKTSVDCAAGPGAHGNKESWARACGRVWATMLPGDSTRSSRTSRKSCTSGTCTTESSTTLTSSKAKTGRPTKTTRTASSATSARAPVRTERKKNSNSGAAIGAACGVTAVVAVIAGALWFTRKKWLHRLKRSKTESGDHYADDMFGGRKSDSTTGSIMHTPPGPLSRAHNVGAAERYAEHDRPDSAAYSSPTSPRAMSDLNTSPSGVMAERDKRYYSVTNPDPPSAGTHGAMDRQGSLSYEDEEEEGASGTPRQDRDRYEGDQSPTSPEDHYSSAGAEEYEREPPSARTDIFEDQRHSNVSEPEDYEGASDDAHRRGDDMDKDFEGEEPMSEDDASPSFSNEEAHMDEGDEASSSPEPKAHRYTAYRPEPEGIAPSAYG